MANIKRNNIRFKQNVKNILFQNELKINLEEHSCLMTEISLNPKINM